MTGFSEYIKTGTSTDGKLLYFENTEINDFEDFLKNVRNYGALRAEVFCKREDNRFDRYFFNNGNWYLDIAETLVANINERKELSI